MATTITINEFGELVEKGKYEVVLSGSYSYSHYYREYSHEVKKSDIPLAKFYHKTLLVKE